MMLRILRFIKRVLNTLRGRDFISKIERRIIKQRFGSINCGWTAGTTSIDENSIIYSFGVGEDISFELALIEKFGVTIDAFDPTPRSIEWVKSQTIPVKLNFHEYGISNYDGKATFFKPDNPAYNSLTMIRQELAKDNTISVDVKSLKTIMKELGDSHIDILKMDIEGAEYDVIEDIKVSTIRPKQILVEFHHRFPSIGIAQSKKAIRTLREIGYQTFAISDNGEEYSFILTSEKQV